MRLVTTCVLFSLCAATAQAEIVTIGAGRDNTLFQDEAGSLSNGIGPSIFAGVTANFGVRRGLLNFKVQDVLPAGAIVTRAELTLYAERARGSNVAMGMHRLLDSWGEGASFTGLGGGVQAERGDATWTSRFYDIGPAWTTPGGDFVAAASAITNVGSAFRSYTWSGVGLVADVQRWANDPTQNFGWLLKAESEARTGEAKRFTSREGTPENRRPRLLIEYTVVPSPGSAGVLLIAGLLAGRRRR